MGLFKKIFGICETRRPADEECWKTSSHEVEIILDKAPELTGPYGAVRLEGRGLPERILLIKGDEGTFHAFKNRCTHMGRRIDPVQGTSTLKCCSISGSVYDNSGKRVSGPAKKALTCYRVVHENDRLILFLE